MGHHWPLSYSTSTDSLGVFIYARPRAQVYQDNESISGIPANRAVQDKEGTCLGQQTSSSKISRLLILPKFEFVDNRVGNLQRPPATVYSPLQSTSSAVFQLHSCSYLLGTGPQTFTVFKGPCPIQLPSLHRNKHFSPSAFLLTFQRRPSSSHSIFPSYM